MNKRIFSFICSIVLVISLLEPIGTLYPVSREVQAASVISINTPAELQKIGTDANYPLDADYQLTADLDMSGIDFTPIGGIVGSRGAVSGDNVFTGTFDGQGHLISNLTISLSESIGSAATAQIGLFANVASNRSDDYAIVKNIVFAEVNIQADITGGYTSSGTLAGEANGYATIDNIAVLSGTHIINASSASDVVGAAGIIGECRTSDSGIGNHNISLTNLYNNAEIIVSSSTYINYVSGIVGRIAKSDCKTLSQCLNTGRTSFRGDYGSGICKFNEASNTCASNCYLLSGSGDADNNIEISEYELTTGVLPSGLPADYWYAAKGSYPLPLICQNQGAAGYLGLIGIAPVFAEDDTASSVTTDFTLPVTVGDQAITWTSSNPDVVSINGATATVANVFANTKVILTASTSSGLKRTYNIVVVSTMQAVFEQNYAKPGTALTVTVKNAPEDMKYTYSWMVDSVPVSGNTGNSYTPTENDYEKFITATITSTNYDAKWTLSMYCSELPVLYLDTEDGNGITNKENYKNAHFKLQGNDEYSSTSVLYDGLTEVKGRGNSTWDYSVSHGLKKPYKIKLDKKSNILGMGKNKHWVLLANMIDHTNMRNQLMYEFSRDIGMETYMDSTNVVLILNGEYEGLYQLCEHKRIDENRIDIFDWEELAEDIAEGIADDENMSDADASRLEDILKEDFNWYETGTAIYNGKTYTVADYYDGTIPEFTGGFMLDMDFRLDSSKYISKFRTTYGYPMFFESPEYAKTSPSMMDYAQTYLQAFEDALHTDDFYATYQNTPVHYSELFDIDSLVQNFFVMEYSMNWDGMKNSTLMYKDLDSQMKMGPAWDFDWCWGNINMYSMLGSYVVTGWHTTEDSFCEQPYQYNNWNRYLISDPYFATLVYEKWQEIRISVIEEMIKDGGKIDTLQEKYSKAAKANDEKWSSTYYKYNGYGITNGVVTQKNSELYDDAITSMKYFINTRVNWFDKQFTSIDSLLASWGKYKGSDTIKFTAIDTDSTEGQTKINITVPDSATDAAFYVNGILVDYSEVANNAAELLIPDTYLRTDDNTLNTVQVRLLDASGNFIKNDSTIITNYTNFTKDIPEILTGTVTIAGTCKSGQTLNAVARTNSSSALTYEWKADGVVIENATSSVYKLTDNEIGKTITVTVTSATESGSLTSTPTSVIEKADTPSEPTAPTDTPTSPTEAPTNPTTEPTGKPSEPTDEPSTPTNEPSTPTNEPTAPTNEPTAPTGKPSEPTDESTTPTKAPTSTTTAPTNPTTIAQSIASCTVVTTDAYYTGKACTPSVVVKNGSITLHKDIDYRIVCTNNTKPETGKLTVVGIGTYMGMKETTFSIKVRKNTKFTTGALKYKVLSSASNKGTVTVTGAANKNAKKITVPPTVRLGNCTFTVTKIAAKAFRNNTKLKNVTIGKNITEIGTKAFENCKKLKKVIVKTKKLNKTGKNLFKGAKPSFTVPAKYKKKYSKLLNK